MISFHISSRNWYKIELVICQRGLKIIYLRIGAGFYLSFIARVVVFNVADMVLLWSICS